MKIIKNYEENEISPFVLTKISRRISSF